MPFSEVDGMLLYHDRDRDLLCVSVNPTDEIDTVCFSTVRTKWVQMSLDDWRRLRDTIEQKLLSHREHE